VKDVEGGNERRTRFCNRFLQDVLHDGVLEPKLQSFADEACFHLSGCSTAQNSRYLGSNDPRQTYEMPFHDQKIGMWYGITATPILGLIF
jgi:hypothetical protein